MPSYLNALGLLCALGRGQPAVAEGLFAGAAAGMRAEDGWVAGRRLTVGSVPGALPAMPTGCESAQSRNNQLLLAAALEIEPQIRAAIARYGASRVGVVIGTSTSGIHEASQNIARFVEDGALPADYRYAQQEMVAPAAFLADWLGLSGPTYCLSTACTSSARALLSAHRLLQQGLCDAVLCGGADSLCRLTLSGFAALEAVSAEPCTPFSVNRQGINIGEGAALFLMTREPSADASSPIALLGGGASSDAYHISAPQPEGLGAQQAMRSALAAAGLAAEQIDYLNLHGTATTHNDAMESLAVQALFPAGVPCSSTKPLSGHCLGAAGALEAAFCWLTLSAHNHDRRLPPHLWDGQADPQLPPLALVAPGARAERPPRYLMSNSFAFGGSNLSLILGTPS
ncbi:beta-ketoacyl-[acyl-carrier-protein] synthase family protein [Pseudomonas lalucatii]|uniref:Beta-ketoacyl-[acyl-carrier-protein] synthase family protein n=1 Tax=Pseudomonas lalucatii TaxID=1424203 RepID=A0ABS5Q0K1_9PSED|nr:beta-ketoacyl-[acyl-carrier-protein] synthase family protein [Pseudomonas lalucatii]MBS7662303.1 beta-ketoacyl-[acyl-carrier-protein] synthase family protein [Pseudomonas lalucatii]MBS7725996.1 beta-ketoacyl-[acyl-carrier-protein] synthase family protein [Pseudomonas lalucatii]QVM88851.1 beta-ketoacyl-[acyl-carrier-protein] synthase family protein [Pseudomonas lalucatii]